MFLLVTILTIKIMLRLQSKRGRKPIDVAKESCLKNLSTSDFSVKLVDSEIGKGLFAEKSFCQGDFLLEYKGKRLDEDDGLATESIFTYFFQHSSKIFCIDAQETDCICKYANDDWNNPNATMKKIVVEDVPHLCLFARRDINVGDEIRYDYNYPNAPWRKIKWSIGQKNSDTGINNILYQNQSDNNTNEEFENAIDLFFPREVGDITSDGLMPHSIGDSPARWPTLQNLADGNAESDSAVAVTGDESTDYVPASSESLSISDLSDSKENHTNNKDDNGCKSKPKKLLNKEMQSKKETNRKKRIPRPCLFCGKFIVKLKRHLSTIHKEEPTICKIFSLPFAKRQQEFDIIRKKGIFQYNMQMLKDRKPLIAERHQGRGSMKICTNCSGFFQRKTFHRHHQLCRSKFGSPASATGLCVESMVCHGDEAFADLLTRFQNDEKGNLCRQDELIKTVGRSQFQKHRKKTEKKSESRKAVMANMRLLASLFVEFKSCATKQNVNVSSENMLRREYFMILEEAIQNIATHEDGALKSGLMVNIGNLLKMAAKVMKGTHLMNLDDEKAEQIEKFEAVLQLRWIRNFGDAEYQVVKNRQSKLRLPSELPIENDVTQIRKYTLETMQREVSDDLSLWGPEKFIVVRNLVISRLTLFNARRGGEPSRLLVRHWEEAKREQWIDKQRRSKAISPMDKFLMDNFKVIYHGGKGISHLVPALVPPDCVEALDALSDPEIRQLCDINNKNEFLFPSTRHSMDHASGWHCTKDVATAAGIKTNITATQMRHRAATLYAELDVPENFRDAFFRHMGHSKEINKNVYQCPLAVQEITQVGSYLANIDGFSLPQGNLHNIAPTPSEKHSISSFEEGEEEFRERETSISTQLQNTTQSSSGTSLCDEEIIGKKRVRRYTRWSPSATSSLLTFFKSYIEDTSSTGCKGTLPGRKIIKEFLEKHHDILEGLCEKEKVCATHTKVFNERNKFRRKYDASLKALTE
ncbi:uncharacterized protein LOC120330366 isoform X1 [Styela clava]